jgi:uncharacterized Zn-binding protein involved in type VI secretion
MAGEIIRLGDKTSHNGTVIEGSQADICMGKPIAYLGHKVYCPKCRGTFPIVEGAMTTTFYGKGVALAGMKTACGATLIASQFTDTVEWGRGSAASGLKTDDHARSASGSHADKLPADEGLATASPQVAKLLEETTWIGFSLSDGAFPRVGERYLVEDANGVRHEGCLDADGQARIEGIPRGQCRITFPDIGQSTEMTP